MIRNYSQKATFFCLKIVEKILDTTTEISTAMESTASSTTVATTQTEGMRLSKYHSSVSECQEHCSCSCSVVFDLV